ncbi:MAG: 16S rRNA (cytosine(967)-C(5))-methyltransferase RsmB [Myxococcota bacterium]|nr:16S rRNA (cytosine(967)-C(5))-methyltransferase RsmB [Myxococcota bacterium]
MKRRRPADARSVALVVLRSLEDESTFLQLKLDKVVKQAGLDSRDRRLAWTLVLGTARWRSHLDAQIDPYLRKRRLDQLEPDVLMILRLATFQLKFMDRIPEHAIVNSSVVLTKTFVGPRATGFVNGLLRTMIRRPKNISFSNAADGIARRYGHPAWLVERYLDWMPTDKTIERCQLNNEPAPLTIRICHDAVDEVINALMDEGATVNKCKVAPVGFHIADHPDPFGSASFKANHWTVQDEASQLVVDLLDVRPRQKVWDACAAPGGKAAYIRDKLAGTGHLLATDINADKVMTLGQTLDGPGVTVKQHDATSPLPQTFDRVLVDAPCTALGLIRRHPEIRWRRQASHVIERAHQQSRLLDNVSDHVSKGGILVYSVCSDIPDEGQAIIEAFLAKHHEFERVPPAAGTATDVLTDDGLIRFDPNDLNCDGFFAARLRRRAD